MSNNGEKQMRKHACGYKFCRGTAGGCAHSLVNGQPILKSIEGVVKDAIQVRIATEREGHRASYHPGLRVALAACPNACTEPQIKDVGIIATMIPAEVGRNCDGCGQCEKVCREEAIIVTRGKAQILPERCVGCGQCISQCPKKAISSHGLRFRILVGGRMGRHPRWAEELCVVDDSDIVDVVQSFLNRITRYAGAGERIANVVERIGVARLREEMFVDV
jgi:dissimilatory sulfite reductase (desulfoviridin) alpha/beta subunit